MVRRERYWVLLIAREYDLAQRFEALPHGRIGQCAYDGGIEAIIHRERGAAKLGIH